MADERKRATIMRDYAGYALEQIRASVDRAAEEHAVTVERDGEDSRAAWRAEARLASWQRALWAVERDAEKLANRAAERAAKAAPAPLVVGSRVLED